MSNITKLEFVALDISRKNYLSWILEVMIKEGNQASLQDCVKIVIFLRHHLHEGF